ncbi:proton-conducting transporter membrane subunit [Streptomyces vietnamensis]|uniref:proton-conducting transporter transmembrane domain-containing protein n=1 Tax=Streptomyces vietnamensis TaxID=362257 RepID=UPI0037B6090F
MDATTTTLLLSGPLVVPCAIAGVHAYAYAGARRTSAVPRPVPLPVGAGPAENAPPPPDADATTRHASPWWGLVPPLTVLVCGALLASALPRGGALSACGGLLRADALTAWMLLVVGAVALIACAVLPSHLAGERPSARDTALLNALVQAFLGAMCLAAVTANLGVLWVAVEAATIFTAFLVGHRHTRRSVEAAWKYVVICSAGIALAFLGTVLVSYAARQAGIDEAHALDWPTLVAHADALDPSVTRLGVSLVILGFGAKAGLVPLHAWLPDAYDQAPAPVSALMSGVLLSVAFSAILRYDVIADAALGDGWTRTLLAGIALLTLALATALLLAQRDHRRMLAYSSMEHMALIALGTAIGTPLARAAVLLHIAGHGLAKAVAFCASGHVLRLTGTTLVGRVRGLLARLPWLGGTFGLAVLALLGFPPFSLFSSELGIVRAGFAAGMGWATATALPLVLIAFAALAARTARMVLGPSPAPAPAPYGAGAVWPLVLGLVACAALGVTTGPLTDLLHDAAAAIGGH